MKKLFFCFAHVLLVVLIVSFKKKETLQWIRINELGYTPAGVKVAVWCTKENISITTFDLIDSTTGKKVFITSAGKNFGAYGPFTNTYRLNFSSFKKRGVYYLKAGAATSPAFKIDNDVYKGAADFCLQYMRQQRSGFNPFLKDSCHTHDGYTLYGPMKDSTHIDVVGGWHDASDYLQYSTTSANATYHLLAAYRDFPKVFTDTKQSNGLEGKNGLADVMDEAQWGLNWLLKMHPQKDWLFNQLGDDRDHMGMRIPKEDSFYGKGFERPVYFVNGEPQQRGRFMNNTTGTTSTAAKFASAFALAHFLYSTDSVYNKMSARKGYYDKAMSAYDYALKKKGVTQTASVRSPYIYAEDNWIDDIELADAAIHNMLNNNKGSGDNGWYMVQSLGYAKQEKLTPWLGADTANHYQWYPFINLGHYELARQLKSRKNFPSTGYTKDFIENLAFNADSVIGYYKTGIQRVWNKAKKNAFYRAVPFIWCSNNLTASFAIQCYWYRQLTNDKSFDELQQANIDWLFGCNPWGTSMVYGLPSWGDTPVDPHSAFTHLKNYPINGGLVDGPVYTSIYKSLIGITLKDADEYSMFQSDLAVYHDDYGDYSTNEPTMDGTASLIYLLAAKEAEALKETPLTYLKGAIIRGNTSKKKISLVFTADEFADGGTKILRTLQAHKAKASFFFTGNFYRNPAFKNLIKQIKDQGHYLGPHSDKHLLYCDWNKRDSLLVSRKEFTDDLLANLAEIQNFGVNKSSIKYFIPPYEWYNDSIAAWTKEMGIQLMNFSPGTKSTADYTFPGLSNYRTSDEIYQSIIEKEQNDGHGLSGFILLIHLGTDPKRTDKFYNRLDKLLKTLEGKGYAFSILDEVFE
ncbi:MAG: cellulase [Chitinophagaceae bacterium]|nr:cellulase [Chitinophagaceae bacterium]